MNEADQAYAGLLAQIKAELPQAVETLKRRDIPLLFPGVGVARLIPWKNELHAAWPLVLGFSENKGGLGVKWSVYLLADGTLIRLRFGLPPYAKVSVEEVVCQKVLSSLTTIATFKKGKSRHFKKWRR